jgi:hypothetical protein
MPLPQLPVPPAILRAGLRVRSRLLDLLDLVLPAEAALWELSGGMQRTALAGALVDSGIANALGDRRLTAEQVAAELELDPEVTARVLGAAVGARLARRDRRGRFRLSRTGGPLRSDHPHSIASWASYMALPVRAQAYGQLTHQLRDGAEPSGFHRVHGSSVWEYFGRHPEQGAQFGAAMRELTAIDLANLVRAYPWPERGRVCDVAGGIGTLLAEILKARPQAEGVLIDAPEVLAEAEAFLTERGVFERVELSPGNFFGELNAEADVYLMKWILHDWSDAHCQDILRRVRATMPPGSRLVVIDQHLPPNGPNAIGSLIDLHMLVECEGGRERDPSQIHSLMRSAGLKPGKVRHAGLQMLVEGVATNAPGGTRTHAARLKRPPL